MESLQLEIMKTAIVALLLWAVAFMGIPGRGAQLEINIIPTVGCSGNSPNLIPNQANIMAGLQNQPRVTDWTTAASWKPFAYLKWPTLTSSTNSAYKLWLGSANPAVDFGPGFSNEMGNSLDWCITVFSRDASVWQTKDLYYSIVCSYPLTIKSSSGNLVSFGTTNQIDFSTTAVGVNYDRVGNPIIYTNGQSPTTPIQDFYYIGPQTAVSVGSQTDLVAARTALTKPGFTITCNVWHQAPDGSADAQGSVTLFTGPELVLQRMPRALACLLSGQPNLLYRIEASSTLQPVSWSTIHSNVTEGAWFTNQFVGAHSFFRAVTP